MQKIPTMYERDETERGHPVQPCIKAECAWVEAGEGTATRKFDGTNVKVYDGELWKRQKPKEGDYDEASYVKADRNDPTDKYIFEAFDASVADGRYMEGHIFEAVGPKIQGNPERYVAHTLVAVVPPSHAIALDQHIPRTFDGLRDYLAANDIEGIVFHHADGRMAKIKKRDFGIKRG